MKKLSKPAKIAVVAAGASIIALTGGAGVLAATDATSTGTNPESSLIDKLVATFGLNKSDVQAVFDQERTERQAEQQLTQAVTDGKLTEDQKSKILAKQQEMQTFMDSLKDKTMDERRAAMDSKRTELRQWVTDNTIPQAYARFVMGMGGPRGGHGGPGMGGPGGRMHDDLDDTSKSSGSSNSTDTSNNATSSSTTTEG